MTENCLFHEDGMVIVGDGYGVGNVSDALVVGQRMCDVRNRASAPTKRTSRAART